MLVFCHKFYLYSYSIVEEFNIFYLGGMKLSEYFEEQKSQAMTSRMKSQLFSRIQKEKIAWTEVSIKLPSKIFFFASRKIMYASLAAVLVFIVFWWILLDKNDVVDFGIFSVQKHTNPNGVLADYVAEIIEFNGEYSLERDGVKISDLQGLKLIEEWDIVTLSEWTDLLFNLADWTQSKIVWPAEFSITKWEDWYQISLVDWKFFRIYCPECASDIEIITPDLSIHQDKDQSLDIHIAKEDNGEMLVKNDWDDVIVKTKKDEAQKWTNLTSTELVAVNTDSEVDIFSDSDLMSLFMEKNNISATFTLSTEKVEWPTIETQPSNEVVQPKPETTVVSTWDANEVIENVPVTPEVVENKDPLLEWIIDVIVSDSSNKWEIDENISIDLWIEADGQKVPTTDQMQSLKTNINSFFLMNLFESIYNQDKVDQNIAKFADRINAVASTFGYSDRASSDLSNIKSTILTLKDKLEKDWYISPSYILQMEKVARWCDELANPSRSNWESLSSDLPINLRLM